MRVDRNKLLGYRLQRARKRSCLSQESVAELISVTRQAVSAWETGASVPSAHQIADLAGVYCESAHVLLFGAHYEKLDVTNFSRRKVVIEG